MGLLYALEAIRNPILDTLMLAVTNLGGAWLFIYTGIVVYWCVSKKYGYYLIAVGMFGTAVNQFLKILCRVPRPWVRDPRFTIVEAARDGAGGYSFPSGHSQNASGILGGIARFTKRKWLRAVCIALIVLVAFSRMYLGVHYPTDVAVGLLCGLVLVFALYPVFDKSDRDPQGMMLVLGAAAALTLAAALYVEYRYWPGDTDLSNLISAVHTLFMVFGCLAAVLIGAPIERKWIRFDVRAPWWAQLLKAALGLALLVALRDLLGSLLTAAFGGRPIVTAAYYGGMVLFGLTVWPLIFSRLARAFTRRRKETESGLE